MARFGFIVDPRFRVPLRLFGVDPARAGVDVADDQVRVHFGPWSLVTRCDNIAQTGMTGPYQWWKVIGVHMSFADRGATFGSSTRRGVCLQFHQPVRARLFNRELPLRHPGLTVTVSAAAALLEALPQKIFGHAPGEQPR